jgi:hypothetical protein
MRILNTITFLLLFSSQLFPQTIQKVVKGYALIESLEPLQVDSYYFVYRSIRNFEVKIGEIQVVKSNQNQYACKIISLEKNLQIEAGDFIKINAPQIFPSYPEPKSNWIKYLDEKKSPTTAALASIAFPGAGHFYYGSELFGFIYLGTRVTSAILIYDYAKKDLDKSTLTGLIGLGLTMYIADIIAAIEGTKKYNERLKEKYLISFQPNKIRFGIVFRF